MRDPPHDLRPTVPQAKEAGAIPLGSRDSKGDLQIITESIVGIIAQGVASGEFEAPDVPLAAGCTCTAMMRFFHPQMIAQCATKPGPSIDQMIDFILASLASRATGTGGAN